jgi:drug/metabolite transporter (DMT)-like permease
MTRRAWLLFAALGVIWGLPYLLIKVSVRDFSPPFLVLVRTGAAALLIVPIALARGQIAPVLRRWRPLVAYTVVELAVPWVLLASAEQHLSSSLSGLLIAAVPIVGAVLARTTGARERLGRSRLVGLALGLGGVAALVGLDVNGSDTLSVLEIGVVVIGYALGPWIFAHHLSDLPDLGIVASSLALCALIYVPAVLVAPQRWPNGREIAAVATLVVVCTALAFLIFFALIAQTGPARATVITYINPAVAVILGVAFLGEKFTVGTGVGFALILAGSYLSTRPSVQRELPAPASAAGVLVTDEWPVPPVAEP